MTNWAVPEFPRNQVDRAGVALVRRAAGREEMEIINNWRSAHSYPLLHFRMNMEANVRRVQKDAVVAQRIKRLDSISAKLTRQSTQLSQMQDIGGCRAILSSIDGVNQLVELYRKSKSAHEFRSEKDYIQSPKPDGYRSRHLIYSYKSARGKYAVYDKLRIEVQIRTALQHAWATAVEAVGIFTREALKANNGNSDWLRLFALMSAHIADIEKTTCVPGVSSDPEIRKKEIIALANSLQALQLLHMYNANIKFIGSNHDGSKYYLMQYDYKSKEVLIRSFSRNLSKKANFEYTEAESLSNNNKNIVLVSVDSIANLRKAYPNYFLDTKMFADVLRSCIEG